MKKLLFLGDSNGTNELLQYAKKRGIYTIVTDYFPPSHSNAKFLSDDYWMISTGELDKLERRCREDNIGAVISGSSDYNTEKCIQLCERLQLPCFCTEEVWKASTDKILFKKLAQESGVLIPTDYEVSAELDRKELDNIKYPVMVKPVDLCANEGVSYCYNEEQLVKAYQYAQSLSDKDKIIVERMLKGVEYCSYYVLAEGEASFLTLDIRIPQSGEPRCCYSMNTTMNNFTKQYLREMDSSVIKLLKKMGCREGIACIQGIWDYDSHFYAFEMCYCPETSYLISPLRRICSFDAISWLLDCAVGVQHSKDRLPQNIWKSIHRCANSYILYSNRAGEIAEIKGIDVIQSLPNVEVRLFIHKGDSIKKYYPLGNIRFDTDNYNQTCDIINQINCNLQIRDIYGENVLIYFNDFKMLAKNMGCF